MEILDLIFKALLYITGIILLLYTIDDVIGNYCWKIKTRKEAKNQNDLNKK